MYMVCMVIDNLDLRGKVLDALASSGIKGATIIDSTGLHRQQRKHLALRYGYAMQDSVEMDNATIFSLVPDRQVAQDCLKIVESVVGDLDQPNTGIFAAWELDLVKGISLDTDEGDLS